MGCVELAKGLQANEKLENIDLCTYLSIIHYHRQQRNRK